MMKLMVVWTLLALPAGVIADDKPKTKLALKGLDPVALVDGQERAGSERWTSTSGQFEYRFVSEENKRKFDAQAGRYRIEFNGACGKMGPFSGQGSPDRFHVHNGRIYLFASEMCREAFKKSPEGYIDRPNAAAKGTAEQIQRGAELVKKALDGFGGQSRVDDLRSLQSSVTLVYKQRDKDVSSVKRSYWAFPDRYRVEEEFSTPYGFAVNGSAAFEIAGLETLPLDAAMREIAWRKALRDPLVMLKNRRNPGFVAVAQGVSKIAEVPVELVAVSLDGATSTWAVDPQTGRILQTRYEDRRGMIGDNVVQFSDFRVVDGLTLPFQSTVTFNGKELQSPKATVDKIVVNGSLKPELFAPAP